MSQYRKTIVVEFFCKAHSVVLEMILFSKKTPSQLLKLAEICWNFQNSFSVRACTCEQPDKATKREQNVIDFGGYFIYGDHFMNRQCQPSDMHTQHQTV